MPPRNPADRPATEPRTEAGRRMMSGPRQRRAYLSDVLAIEAEAAQGAAPPTEDAIRQWLWTDCRHDGKYGDDGEMQCRGVDFRRDPLLSLIAHVIRAAASEGAAPRAEGLEGALRVLVSTASRFISRSGSLPSNAAQHVIELDIAIDHAIQALDAGGHEPVNDQQDAEFSDLALLDQPLLTVEEDGDHEHTGVPCRTCVALGLPTDDLQLKVCDRGRNGGGGVKDDTALREALERLLEEASPFASELTVLLEPMSGEDRARLRAATAHARKVLGA